MNENELKNVSVENNSYQKSSKAEKILAIKRALQTGNMNAEERLSDIISDIAPNDSDDRIGDEQTFENEWEREIAERIARRSNQNKDSKILLNDILSENLPVENKKIKPISRENFETAKENPFDFQKNMQESGETVSDNIAAAELQNTDVFGARPLRSCSSVMFAIVESSSTRAEWITVSILPYFWSTPSKSLST